MSDARTTPPSFDELVGLIKKLFTDYLEDVMKTPPSEIGKSWERYKTLNHLYQDESPAEQPVADLLFDPELFQVMQDAEKSKEANWEKVKNGMDKVETEQPVREVDKKIIDFIRDVAKNWDCDEDGHKYNTGCRKCDASELLYNLTRQSKPGSWEKEK